MIISLGKIEIKFFIYLLLYLLLNLLLIITNLYFKEREEEKIKNRLLNYIISYGFNIFFIIPECANIKKYFCKKKEYKKSEVGSNKIIYIFNSPYGKINCKSFFYIALGIFIYFIYNFFGDIYISLHYEYFKFTSTEFYRSLEILYLYLFYRLIIKTLFYKHHILSLIMLILMEFIRYVIQMFFIEEIGYNFPFDLVYFIPVIFFPSIEALVYYLLKKVLSFKYYSEFFICFIVGFIFISCTIIILSISLNIDCGDNTICQILSEKDQISIEYTIMIYILISMLKGFILLFMLKTINDFTVFHLIIFFALKDMISDIIGLFIEYTFFDLIIILVTYTIEIFALLVFVEMVELNFCGLNQNLKRFIRNRADRDINLIYESNTDENVDEETINFSIDEASIEIESINDKTSVY